MALMLINISKDSSDITTEDTLYILTIIFLK